MTKNIRTLVVTLVGVLLGVLMIQQYQTYQTAARMGMRDQNTNVFREIRVLQDSNDVLNAEIQVLTERLGEYKDTAEHLAALDRDIEQNLILSGQVPVEGPGLVITLDRSPEMVWLVDLINELFAARAEAVAVNDIRLTNQNLGITPIGQQLTLQRNTLNPPLTLKVIGGAPLLQQALEQPGGILKRLEARYPEMEIKIESQTKIILPANTQPIAR